MSRRRPGRPATGVTPKRDIRIGAVWDRCRVLAAERGESMAAFVTRALEAEEQRCGPGRPGGAGRGAVSGDPVPEADQP